MNVDGAWKAVGEEHGLTHEQAQSLYTQHEHERTAEPEQNLAQRFLADVTRDRSMVVERDVYARAYELSPGNCHPTDAHRMVGELARTGELVALQGGMWTTRELRERERQTVQLAESRARGERHAGDTRDARARPRADGA